MSTDEAIPQEAYGEAIARPESAFADHRLRVMEPAIDPERGAPVVTLGRYAASYRLIDPFWVSPPLAVRCYLQQPPDLVGRYRALAAYLGDRTRSFPGLVPMELIEKGIQVRIGAIGRTWEPIVIHPWVPGRRLDVVVREAIANGSAGHVLPALRERLVALARFLEDAGIAHGDVEPANLIVGEDGGLTLVDADGMVVPVLVGRPTVEELTPHWRHPRRPERADLALDRFPFIVLWVTLLVLERAPELLVGRPEAPDGRLLFLADDLAAPERSLLFTRTERIAGASGWTHALAELARGDYAAVPALAAFAALPVTDRPAPEAVAWPVTDHRVEVDAGADAGTGVEADAGGGPESGDGVAEGAGVAADPWTGSVEATELPSDGTVADAEASSGPDDPWMTAEPAVDVPAPDPWVTAETATADAPDTTLVDPWMTTVAGEDPAADPAPAERRHPERHRSGTTR